MGIHLLGTLRTNLDIRGKLCYLDHRYQDQDFQDKFHPDSPDTKLVFLDRYHLDRRYQEEGYPGSCLLDIHGTNPDKLEIRGHRIYQVVVRSGIRRLGTLRTS